MIYLIIKNVRVWHYSCLWMSLVIDFIAFPFGRWTQHALFFDRCQHQLSELIEVQPAVRLKIVLKERIFVILTSNWSRASMRLAEFLMAMLAQNSECERAPFLSASSSSNKTSHSPAAMQLVSFMCKINSARLILWSLSVSVFWNISRLNSQNFEILYPDDFYSNLNSWVKSTLKIIQNDTIIG